MARIVLKDQEEHGKAIAKETGRVWRDQSQRSRMRMAGIVPKEQKEVHKKY